MRILTAVALTALVMAAGCGPMQPASPMIALASVDDLSARMTVDKPLVYVGDTLKVSLTVHNTGGGLVTVQSPSTAPMVVTVWRYNQAKGWERAKQYPLSTVGQRTTWNLSGHERRDFTMTLPVEPDWPVLEKVKVTAELNGRPDLRPFVDIVLMPADARKAPKS